MSTQELKVGDRVFCLRSGKRGTVTNVDEFRLTYGRTYWIDVKWDGKCDCDRLLENQVGLLKE